MPGCAPCNVYSAPCLAVPHATFIVPHAWLCPMQRLLYSVHLAFLLKGSYYTEYTYFREVHGETTTLQPVKPCPFIIQRSVQFSSVQFSSVQFSSVQFGSVRFSSVRLFKFSYMAWTSLGIIFLSSIMIFKVQFRQSTPTLYHPNSQTYPFSIQIVSKSSS